MSGSTIGGFVGAGIGFLVGGPAGARWGWMIGSAVGGYVDPAQIEGPRLQDVRAQTSRDGIPIPFGWGTFPLMGNIIAQGPVVEHEKTESQGKGGPEVTNYTYTRTYAVGLCEGPITGVLQVKRNGKVVYDARTDEDLLADIARELQGVELTGFIGSTFVQIAAAIRAANSRFDNKVTFYLGDETQMPDPALEAIFGAGKVPAHRGLAYFVVEDDDVTDTAGAIPQFEVVVVGQGTATERCGGNSLRDKAVMWLELDEASGTVAADQAAPSEPSEYFSEPLVGGVPDIEYDGPALFANGGSSKRFRDTAAVFSRSHAIVKNNAMNAGGQAACAFSIWFQVDMDSFQARHFILKRQGGTSSGTLYIDVDGASGRLRFNLNFSIGGGAAIEFMTPAGTDYSTGQTYHLVFNKTATEITIFVNSVLVYTQAYTYSLGGDVNGESWIGAAQGDDMFDGYLSQAIWFNDTLTQAEIDLIYNEGNGITYSLIVPAGAVPMPDAPGSFVMPDGSLYQDACPVTIEPSPPLLATIVADVCERRGLTTAEYDVSQLTDLVPGFVVGRETDAASIIQSLTPAYFFDPAEWDGKLRFIKRGGTAVASINGDDLVERDGDAFERERVQEAELLRRVTVAYNDPLAGYAPTTQKWERRAGTVQALGEASVELPLTLAADDAATIAKRRGLTAWGEPEKQKFSLPYRLAKLTPTDVINYTDDDGAVHTLRLMDLQDDSGVRYVESSANRAEAYGATASGVLPAAPSLTDPSLRGPTMLAVMDLPLWRGSDSDTLGLYVAARGYVAGWQGAVVAVSTDSGASYSNVTQITQQAAIGTTTTALVAEVSSEYPSAQTVTVTLPRAPESVSYESLLRYNNRAAIQLDSGEWAILQYQAVVAVDATTFTLSGIVHGRYATTPGAAASGATFVLLDAAVQFVPVERYLLGETVKVRATTFGTSSDAAVPVDVAFTAGASQSEWPVHNVTATRDGSDNVTVTWVGRARLGVETAPYHSTNFAGYRVSWDDGVTVTTADTTDTTYTITAAADPIDVTVTPLNSITGAGPASEAITV